MFFFKAMESGWIEDDMGLLQAQIFPVSPSTLYMVQSRQASVSCATALNITQFTVLTVSQWHIRGDNTYSRLPNII